MYCNFISTVATPGKKTPSSNILLLLSYGKLQDKKLPNFKVKQKSQIEIVFQLDSTA